jgi:hypothetical protein
VFGDGYVYLMTLEVQTNPECKTPTQPWKRYCSGGVCYEEGRIVRALFVKLADLTDVENNNATWVGMQETYRSLEMICGGAGENIRNNKLTSAKHNLQYSP